MGVSGNFLKATGSQVFVCGIEFDACHDKSICRFLTCSVFIDDGVRVCVGLWRGFKFSVC